MDNPKIACRSEAFGDRLIGRQSSIHSGELRLLPKFGTPLAHN